MFQVKENYLYEVIEIDKSDDYIHDIIPIQEIKDYEARFGGRNFSAETIFSYNNGDLEVLTWNHNEAILKEKFRIKELGHVSNFPEYML